MLRSPSRLLILTCLSLCVALLAACSTQRPPRPAGLASNPEASWSGKLNITIESQPKESFSTEFDLQGDPLEGSMQFYTSLGTTVASTRWDNQGAALLIPNKESLHFNSIQALSQKYMGAALPVDMIFAWANGQPPAAPPGWTLVDNEPPVQQATRGSSELKATRNSPLPKVHLRVWLQRSAD